MCFKTGRVAAVIPNLVGLAIFEAKAMTQPKDQGVHFPTVKGLAQPTNHTWMAGAGMYGVLIPGWNPNHAQ